MKTVMTLVFALACLTINAGVLEFQNLTGSNLDNNGVVFPPGITRVVVTSDFVDGWNGGWGDSDFGPINTTNNYIALYSNATQGFGPTYAMTPSEQGTASMIQTLTCGALVGFMLVKGIKWA